MVATFFDLYDLRNFGLVYLSLHERFRDKGLIIKRHINVSVYFTLLLTCNTAFCIHFICLLFLHAGKSLGVGFYIFLIFLRQKL